MSVSDLYRFQQVVFGDVDLQNELRGCLDREDFVARVIERARARDFVVDRADISAAFDAAARNWITRGMER